MTHTASVMPGTGAEKAVYELPEIWEPGWFPKDDYDRVAEDAGLLPPEATTLLDVGCGNGLFLNHLAGTRPAQFTRLVGVDRSAAALRHVFPAKCRVDIAALPFAPRAFDIVTCMEVLEHLPAPAYPLALAELARVSRRFVMVTVPWRQDLDASLCRCPSCRALFNGDFHLRRYDETAMGALLVAQRFRAVWTRPRGGRQVFSDQLVLSRLERWWRGQPEMPANAICPACGHRDSDALQRELARRVSLTASSSSKLPRRGPGLRLLSAFRPTTMTYQRIAALYERLD